MIWYFVRHGKIYSNKVKVYAGWSDEELTDEGIRQAEKAGQVLKDKGIGWIYCSPLKRTVQTAGIIGQILGKRPILDDSFKELRLGAWEGMSEIEVARKFPEEWKLWNTRPGELVLGGRETLDELLDRVLDGLARLWQRVGNARILVVTHVAIVRVLVLKCEKKSLNLYKTISVPNGKVFEIHPEKLIDTNVSRSHG